MPESKRFRLFDLSEVLTNVFYGPPETVGVIRVRQIDEYLPHFDTVTLDLGSKERAEISDFIFKAPQRMFRGGDIVEVLVRRSKFLQDEWLAAIRHFELGIYGTPLDNEDKVFKDMFSAGFGSSKLSPMFYERFIKKK